MTTAKVILYGLIAFARAPGGGETAFMVDARGTSQIPECTSQIHVPFLIQDSGGCAVDQGDGILRPCYAEAISNGVRHDIGDWRR